MNDLVIVRGGGDISTGSIQKLHRVGFKVLVLEIEKPTCIRRGVSAAEAMYVGYTEVEDLCVRKVNNLDEIKKAWENREVPIIEDASGKYTELLKPIAVVDAIIAKKNMGTKKSMAPITIGLGPGFEAGVDVDIVIETNRGHDLGRIIFQGKPEENTGNPWNNLGFTTERILRASYDGEVKILKDLGSIVKKDEIVAYVNDKPVKAGLDGMVRGMIRDGAIVTKGMKMGDVDPRVVSRNLDTISDKARAIGGNVLEAILIMKRKKSI